MFVAKVTEHRNREHLTCANNGKLAALERDGLLWMYNGQRIKPQHCSRDVRNPVHLGY